MVQDLAEALNGEFNAIRFYEHLAQLAPNEEVKKRILEIGMVEHFPTIHTNFWDAVIAVPV